MTAPASFYRDKTWSLLEKYGPGPRVHYHVGFADAAENLESLTASSLRARLHAAQEAVLIESVEAWAGAPGGLGEAVLDAGCGLGGGALYLADRCGCRVVALTHVAEHARVVKHFAACAGLGNRVAPVVADAHAIPTRELFDAVIAIESACYFDTRLWFEELCSVLRPGGRVFMIDGFLADAAIKDEFDAYWRTNLASRTRAVDLAYSAGFELIKEERLNARALGFWDLSIAWNRRRLMGAPAARRRHLERSLSAHERFRAMYAEGQVDYLRLAWRKSEG